MISHLLFTYSQGTNYIQNSALKSHGHITSDSCMIDNRWSLKIGMLGLQRMRRQHVETETKGEYQTYKGQWRDITVTSHGRDDVWNKRLVSIVVADALLLKHHAISIHWFGAFCFSTVPSRIMLLVIAYQTPGIRPRHLYTLLSVHCDHMSPIRKDWNKLIELIYISQSDLSP